MRMRGRKSVAQPGEIRDLKSNVVEHSFRPGNFLSKIFPSILGIETEN